MVHAFTLRGTGEPRVDNGLQKTYGGRNSEMEMKSVRLLLAFVVFWSSACGGAPAGDGGRGTAEGTVPVTTPTAEEINERCRRILSRFMVPELEKSETLHSTLERAVFHREKTRISLDATYLGRDFGATIDVDQGVVGIFMDFRQRPHPRQDLPDTLDAEKFEKAIIKRGGILMDQAVDVARRFIIERAGEEALQGLVLFKHLAPSYYQPTYDLRWDQRVGNPKVRFGRRWVSVEINPFTGGIWSYCRTDQPVSLPPKMSLDECRRIAAEFLRDDGMEGIRLLDYWYLDVRMVDGTVRPIWYVGWTSENARDSIPLPKVVTVLLQDVEIDALTGQVRFSPVDAEESWPWEAEESESATPTASSSTVTPTASR